MAVLHQSLIQYPETKLGIEMSYLQESNFHWTHCAIAENYRSREKTLTISRYDNVLI